MCSNSKRNYFSFRERIHFKDAESRTDVTAGGGGGGGEGASHYAKDSGFGITSGGWSTYFGCNIPTVISRSIFDKPVLCPN